MLNLLVPTFVIVYVGHPGFVADFSKSRRQITEARALGLAVFRLDKEYAMTQEKQEKTLTEPVVMDTVNAASYLDMKPGTLEIWRSTKREGPPYIKVGRSVKYRRSDLDAWLEQRTHRATQEAQ
jgi:predicted DNA-binding transcriptional regulator AlpA